LGLRAEKRCGLVLRAVYAKSIAKAEGILLAAAGATPELGRNALMEQSHQLLATKDIAKGIPGAQLNWTCAQGGLVRNQIPERAFAFGDVRLSQPGAADKLRAALESKIKESYLVVSDTEVSIKIDAVRPLYLAGERGLALAQRAHAIYAELDGRPLLLHPSSGSGTDAGYAGRSGKPVVLESLGLTGYGYHAKDEYIEIDSIVRASI